MSPGSRIGPSVGILYAPADGDQEPRHVGTLEPLWNLFDLTLEGRPSDWHEHRSY